MTQAADPYDAIKQALLEDDTISALVGDRVGFEVDEDDNTVMPRACIVLTPAAGPGSPGGGRQQWGKVRVAVTCYGATLTESRKLSLAVYLSLKLLERQLVNGVLLHGCECSAKSSTARDPVTQWPTTYSTWLVTHGELAAT